MSARGNKFILTLVDHFSKWAEAIPLPNHKAPTVARALMTHVFARFGAPRQLLTDRGTEFESELFSELMKLMGVDKLRTTAYKPSTNGTVERFHRTLNSLLGKTVSESHRDWDEWLPQVLAAYRASPHASTGFSPNRLFLGRDANMPLDLVMGLPAEESRSARSTDDYVREMGDRIERCWKLARDHLRVAAERRKVTYDIRAKESQFHEGDWVWYWCPRRYKNRSPKWQRCYTGPYLIVRVIAPVNYVLQKSARSKAFVVHADKIKKCYGATPSNWLCIESEGNGSLTLPSPGQTADAGSTLLVSQPVISAQPQREVSVPVGRVPPSEPVDVRTAGNISRKRQVRPPAHMSDYVCNRVIVDV
jgi:hypothetical protein